MSEERIVWLARGPCASCGRPGARRVDGPGAHAVACNVCKATTTHDAARMRMGPAGLEPATLEEPAPLAHATAGLSAVEIAPASPRRRMILWGALAGAGVLLLALGLLLWPGGGVLGAEAEWAVVAQRVVPEFGADEAHFRVETRGWDINENEIPEADLRGLQEWHFASTPALVEPGNVTGWTQCDPRECDFAAPLGSFVHLSVGEPEAFGALAFDTGARKLYRFSIFDGWEEIADWEAHLASFRTAKLMPLGGDGENARWWVEVLVNNTGSEARDVTLQLVQGDEEIGSRDVHAWPYDPDFSFTSMVPELSSTAEEGSVELRVLDAEGVLLVSKTFVASDCERGARLSVVLSPEGFVSIDELVCT